MEIYVSETSLDFNAISKVPNRRPSSCSMDIPLKVIILFLDWNELTELN
jgi:hypothetical protein